MLLHTNITSQLSNQLNYSTMDHHEFKYISRAQIEWLLKKVQQRRQETQEETKLVESKDNVPPVKIELDKIETGQSSLDLHSLEESLSKSSCDESSESLEIDLQNLCTEVWQSELQSKQMSLHANEKVFLHKKTVESIIKTQFSISSLLMELRRQLNSKCIRDEVNEPTSARDKKNKELRLLEFTARFRRNYLYSIQQELQKSCRFQGLDPSKPRNSSKQMVLRSLSRAHTFIFQGLQVYIRQSHALPELLTSHVLFEDLLQLLAQLSESSAAHNLINEDLNQQRRLLRDELAEKTLETKLDKCIVPSTALCTRRLRPNKQSSKLPWHLNTCGRRMTKVPKNKGARKSKSVKQENLNDQLPHHVNNPENYKLHEQADMPQRLEFSSTTPVVITTKEENPNLNCKALNARLLIMNHDSSSTLAVSESEVCQAGTQTLALSHVATQTPREKQVVESSLDIVTLQSIPAPQRKEEEFSLENVQINPSTVGLVCALLREATGETDHMGNIVDQILREEFL